MWWRTAARVASRAASTACGDAGAATRQFILRSAAPPTGGLASSAPRLTTSLLLLASAAATAASVAACSSSPPRRSVRMESPVAVQAEERYNDSSYDRRQLLADLRESHATHPEDVGVSWRLTRAAYDVANLRATPAAEKKELTYYARDVIERTLDGAQDVPEVHKWVGIILSSIGDYEGSKVSIANSFVIKGHWDKAVELNPQDATTYYLLGRWCIAIADLSWLERKAAAVLFGSPPEATYAEALEFLMKSEALAPDSWKKRTLLIAQVHQKMKDAAAAKDWTARALALPVSSDEDEQVQEEAAALLKKL